MEHAYARRPSADDQSDRDAQAPLRAVSPMTRTPSTRREPGSRSAAESRRSERTAQARREDRAARIASFEEGFATGVGDGRRTVQISSAYSDARPRPRPRQRQHSRPARSAVAAGPNPDRLALWAVILCLFMALVAAATARGEDQPQDPVAEPPAAAETRR